MELQEHRKLLYTNFSISDIIFKKENYFEQINLKINDEISKKTDLIYNDFYERNKKLIIFYFFSFLIIGIDLTLFFFAMKFERDLKIRKNKIEILISIPLMIIWILSIVILIILSYKENEIKKNVKELIKTYKNKLKCANDNNIEILSKKLRVRTQYYGHYNFKICLQGFILSFIPFVLKIFIFKNSKYKVILCISSILLIGIMFITSLIKLILIKIKNHYQGKRNNINYYEEKYPNNENLGLIKKNINNYRSYYSENIMNFSFFFTKLFIGILFVLYFTQIGDKLDNPIKGCSWLILFIPIYILFAPLLAFVIIHCISFLKFFKYKIILILTIFPSFFGLMANGILLPMILENRISISFYYIPLIFLISIIFFGIHLIIIFHKINIR